MTRFDLPHIAARLYGTPLLVAPPKMETIVAALGPRIAGDAQLLAPAAYVDDEDDGRGSAHRSYAMTDSGIAVLPVVGSMVRRGAFLDAMSGLRSYASLQSDVQAALDDPAVRGLLLELDTPGGEAGGAFDAFDAIRTAANRAGKPIWAIANEGALSAGYALAAVADRIWVTRTGEVGSVGVVALHIDQSKADAQKGLKYTYIHAGAHKVEGNPHEPLADGTRAALQADVDALYGMFIEHVAQHRGMAPERLRATEAQVYRGADALTAGLADELGTLPEALAAFARALDRSFGSVVSSGGRAALTTKRTEKAMSKDTLNPAAEATETDDVLVVEVVEPEALIEDAPETTEPAPAEAESAPVAPAAAAVTVTAEHAAKIIEVAEMAAKLGVKVDAAKAIREGVLPSAIESQIVRVLADKADAQPTVTAHAAPSSASAKAGESWGELFAKKRR
jgi:capsid assembly protease